MTKTKAETAARKVLERIKKNATLVAKGFSGYYEEHWPITLHGFEYCTVAELRAICEQVVKEKR